MAKKDSDDIQLEEVLSFPDKFPIKVFTLNQVDAQSKVEKIIQKHVKTSDILSVTSNLSGSKKYIAVTVTIMAKSRAQLDEIYLELTSTEFVTMAL